MAAGLVAAGGGLGLVGVALSAAAAHTGGDTRVVLAGQFCLFHAATVISLAAITPTMAQPWLSAAASVVLFIGVTAFSGDLTLAGLAGVRPLPAAAPIGGGLLLVGWALVVAAGVAALRSPQRPS